MRERPILLAIDDNPSFLGTLAVLLERLNCDVLPVTTCRDAFDLARVARPQVISLNMQMPDMDSLAFLRALRADAELADIPVIMITAERDKQRIWEAMSLGCIEVLDRPLELGRLHQALQRCRLYPEKRRRYLRAAYPRRVGLIVHGQCHNYHAVSLSERGIMVRMPQPLPKGTAVEVRLSLPDGEILEAGGEVIDVRAAGNASPAPLAGVTIRFSRVTLEDTEKLQELLKQLLIGDLLANQTEPVFSPD